MEMGNSDGGGGGFYYFGGGGDSGGGLWGSIIALVAIVALMFAIGHCRAEQRRAFCADVCSQYHDEPVVQGSQCYCRDHQGIYDPARAR